MRKILSHKFHIFRHVNVLIRPYHFGPVFEMEILAEESINPAFKRVNFEVRGWLEDRLYEIRQELARVSRVALGAQMF